MIGIEALVSLLTMLRLPRVAALVLSVLLMESRPMSLGEISAVTGYAKSHLSSALKLLESSSLVERVVTGKKVVFRPRKKAVELLLRKHLQDIRKALNEVRSKLNTSSLSESIDKVDVWFKEIIRELGGEDVWYS
ncbi:MAG: hypothetical protein J7L55_02570 [Desulfurococcales archaeon]|nr:hypothetical protein [Desulfurococcales archaeon]